jgi:putative redox protein
MNVDNELTVRTELANDRMLYRSLVDAHPPIVTDYVPPYGDDQGPTSLELFLVSLATCAGSAVAQLLRKMRKEVAGLTLEARGTRRTEHPQGFEAITLELRLVSSDTSADELANAVRLAEEKICPVWSMIKGNVSVSVRATVQKAASPGIATQQ